MEIIELHKTEMAQIKPLWKLLNQTHLENSNYWKEHFSKQTFEERFDQLQKAKNTLLLIAKVDNEIVAYCFSTANDVSGEIASIYVTKQYRKQNVGKALIMQSVEWFKKNNIHKIIVGVAEGNEVALPFYEELGFKKSATVLKLHEK